MHFIADCDTTAKKETDANPNITNPTMTPLNGIQDPVSAQMLCSELDLLENSPNNTASLLKTSQNSSSGAGRQGETQSSIPSDNKLDRTRLNLDLKEVGDNRKVGHSSTAGINEAGGADWVVLECCFGVPLFASELNSQVCNKILENALCKKER